MYAGRYPGVTRSLHVMSRPLLLLSLIALLAGCAGQSQGTQQSEIPASTSEMALYRAYPANLITTVNGHICARLNLPVDMVPTMFLAEGRNQQISETLYTRNNLANAYQPSGHALVGVAVLEQLDPETGQAASERFEVIELDEQHVVKARITQLGDGTTHMNAQVPFAMMSGEGCAPDAIQAELRRDNDPGRKASLFTAFKQKIMDMIQNGAIQPAMLPE